MHCILSKGIKTHHCYHQVTNVGSKFGRRRAASPLDGYWTVVAVLRSLRIAICIQGTWTVESNAARYQIILIKTLSVCLSVCPFVCPSVHTSSRTTGYETAYERYLRFRDSKDKKGETRKRAKRRARAIHRACAYMGISISIIYQRF